MDRPGVIEKFSRRFPRSAGSSGPSISLSSPKNPSMSPASFLKRTALAVVASLLCVSQLAAQDLFFGAMNGASVVPPSPSGAIGRAWANFDRATGTLWYCVENNVVNPVGARIHQGAAGINGAAQFNLAGGPAVYGGTTIPLNAAQQ